MGFLDRFDELVVMLRRRLGWLSQKDMAYLRTNHYRHPKVTEWPPNFAQELNGSLPIATDHAFLALVEKQYREQVLTWNESAMLILVDSLPSTDEFTNVMKYLPLFG